MALPIGGGLFDGMSDEEYQRLLGLVRGAGEQGGESRFPKGAYENMVGLKQPALASAVTSESSAAASAAPKMSALDGEGALTRFRIGTLQLPKLLLERIRDVLRGTLATMATDFHGAEHLVVLEKAQLGGY